MKEVRRERRREKERTHIKNYMYIKSLIKSNIFTQRNKLSIESF